MDVANGQGFHAPRNSHQHRRQHHADLAAALLAQRRQLEAVVGESAAAPATLTVDLPPLQPTATTLLKLLPTSSGSPVTAAAAAASVDRSAGVDPASTASAAIFRPSMLPAVAPTQDGTTTAVPLARSDLASLSSTTTTAAMPTSAHTKDPTHTEAHATHINEGTLKAMQALMLGFSLLFLGYALYQLPWTVARMSRGGWRSGWALRTARPSSSSGRSRASAPPTMRVSHPKRAPDDSDDDDAAAEDRTDLVPVGLTETLYNEGWSAPSLIRATTPLARFPRPSLWPHYTCRVPGLNVTLKEIAYFAPFALITTLASVVKSHYLWDATRTGW
jgi:hypothetical protein